MSFSPPEAAERVEYPVRDWVSPARETVPRSPRRLMPTLVRSAAKADVSCAYDSYPVLTSFDAASRGPHGETISVWHRSQSIVDRLTVKYGQWHKNARIADALRVGYRNALATALIAMPVVLARPIGGLRYAVIHREAAVGLADDGRLGVITDKQEVASARVCGA
jgi:hypothetical protein